MNSITLLSTGSATLGVVELPQEAYDIKIHSGNYSSILKYKLIEYSAPIEYQITLYPVGLYEIVGWSDEISSDQAKELVEGFGLNKWKNYGASSQYQEVLFDSATDSFNSFLLSHGITERKLILKQVI